jgi:hypothetical protein
VWLKFNWMSDIVPKILVSISSIHWRRMCESFQYTVWNKTRLQLHKERGQIELISHSNSIKNVTFSLLNLSQFNFKILVSFLKKFNCFVQFFYTVSFFLKILNRFCEFFFLVFECLWRVGSLWRLIHKRIDIVKWQWPTLLIDEFVVLFLKVNQTSFCFFQFNFCVFNTFLQWHKLKAISVVCFDFVFLNNEESKLHCQLCDSICLIILLFYICFKLNLLFLWRKDKEINNVEFDSELEKWNKNVEFLIVLVYEFRFLGFLSQVSVVDSFWQHPRFQLQERSIYSVAFHFEYEIHPFSSIFLQILDSSKKFIREMRSQEIFIPWGKNLLVVEEKQADVQVVRFWWVRLFQSLTGKYNKNILITIWNNLKSWLWTNWINYDRKGQKTYLLRVGDHALFLLEVLWPNTIDLWLLYYSDQRTSLSL